MEISLLADYPAEIEPIAKWYFDQWSHNNPNETFESVKEYLATCTNRTEVPVAFVAHVDGELAGAGELKFCQEQAYPGYDYWIDGIYVSPTYRGKGISTALVEFAKSMAISLQLPVIYLRCLGHLVKLYEARGFQVVATTADKFIMELKIKPV